MVNFISGYKLLSIFSNSKNSCLDFVHRIKQSSKIVSNFNKFVRKLNAILYINLIVHNFLKISYNQGGVHRGKFGAHCRTFGLTIVFLLKQNVLLVNIKFIPSNMKFLGNRAGQLFGNFLSQ